MNSPSTQKPKKSSAAIIVTVILVVLVGSFLVWHYSKNGSGTSDRTKQLEEAHAMGLQYTEYTKTYGDDARAKMILKYGDAKMKWYDSISADSHDSYERDAAAEQAKIDSINATLNK